MGASVKIAISLPGEEFKELEAYRNKEGISEERGGQVFILDR